MRRIVTGLLWMGGIVLAALMVYTVALDLGRPSHRLAPRSALDAIDVAVVFPEREYWTEFRAGIDTCARRGLARIVEDGDDSVVITIPTHGRRVRFSFHDVRGLRETRAVVAALTRRPAPPVALIGSSNTALTAALADALRTAAGPDAKEGPVLLVPWASAVLVERAEPEAGPVALLDLDPGRMFRFCPNNQREADLAVRALADHDAGTILKRAYIIEDRHDPYSVDLADCFHRAIERIAPEAEVVDHADILDFTGISDGTDLPSPSEDALAETIWGEAKNLSDGRVLWVVLPLQEQPANRMLLALRRHVNPRGADRLRVVCGDGMSLKTLMDLTVKPPFPVWCVSFDTPAAFQGKVAGDATAHLQIPVEIVSVLVRCLDESGRASTPAGLRQALLSRHFGTGDRPGQGRSIAFTPTGERQGDDLGHVLMIRPGSTSIFSVAREASGRWGAPVAVWPGQDEGRP